ncbi:hypothetical protein [Murinocardiopsis flavida]|nr:hypothetical protein [Murinocardiopsis flavida]
MEDRPGGLDEGDLRDALKAWGITAAALEYAPVGFGDYHWTVGDGEGPRWFATVSDLPAKNHCGTGADAAGREPDPSAMEFYRLRWDLEEAAGYVDQFRSPHERTPDTETAWSDLSGIVAQLAGDGPA